MTRRTSLIALLLLCASPASAAWQEYVYADLNVAKEFPAPPKVAHGTYRTPSVGANAVPATIYSVEDDNILYRMTVADLEAPEFVARSASLMAECVALAEKEGRVRATMPQRVEDGTAYRVYGQMVSVDLNGNQGRKQTNCFYTKGRLYKIEAWVRPAHGELDSPAAIRFSSSVRFRLDTADAPSP
jgi:hypothetical protein